MKSETRIPVYLNIVLILSLLLAGCGKGVLDVQIVPQGQATPSQPTAATVPLVRVPTELPHDALAQIQPIALSFLAGDVEDRQPFLQYQATPCSNQPGLGQPACSPGESEGQVLQVFPLGAGQVDYLRPEDIRQRLDFQVKDLYAIYRFTAEQNKLPASQPGEYGLLFDREANGQPEPVLAVVTDGKLVRVEFYPGKKVDEVLNRVPVAQVILPPQQAHAWSEPLQQLQLQSQTEISPDRRWNAQTTLALPAQPGQPYYRRLIVSSQDNISGFQDGVKSYTLVDEWAEFGSGYRAPRPLAWFGMSPTEFPFLYWSFVPVMEDCQSFYNGSDLHRLDLERGDSRDLLVDVGDWLAVSPDQGRAAVAGNGKLGIYNLSNGQGRFMELPKGQTRQVIWSPDGREVALTIADSVGSACAGAQAATHTILRIDADTLAIKWQLAKDARRLVTQSWSQLGLIRLSDADSKTWLLDPQTSAVWDELSGRPTTTPNIEHTAQVDFYPELYQEDIQSLTKLAERFNAENPGIQINVIDASNFFDEARVTGADCRTDRSWPGEHPDRSESLLDLRPLLVATDPGLTQDYWPEQLEMYQLDGKLYGLPMVERPSMIFYNAELLAQKGIPAPSPDWSVDEFLALLTTVSGEGAGDKVYGFPAMDGSMGQFMEGIFGPVFDSTTNPPTARFISPEMAAGLEHMAELRRSGAIVYIPSSLYAGQDYYDVANAWLSGRVAFWQYLFGEVSLFNTVEQPPTFQIGMAPLPAHGPLFRNGYSVQQGFYIQKDSPNAAACLAWYRYVTSHPEAMSGVPVLRSMIENPAWRARVGEANAVALQTAIQRVYTEPLMFSTPANPASPLVSWLYYAVIDYLTGSDAQLVMSIAQSKADKYAACLAPQVGPGGTIPDEAVWDCARQADPGRW